MWSDLLIYCSENPEIVKAVGGALAVIATAVGGFLVTRRKKGKEK